MLKAVLLDVGGTLWPERLPPVPGVDPCLEPLGEALSVGDPNAALAVIRQYLREDEESLEQDTHALVALAIRSLADGRQADAVAVVGGTTA